MSPELDDGIHIWRVELDLEPEQTTALIPRLCQEERARAGGFILRRARQRFIVAHAALRAILGTYTGTRPDSVQFAVGPYGRPRLADANMRMEFNLSHSGGLGLIGLARGRTVGIDVEQVVADLPSVALAERFLAPEERAFVLGRDGGSARAFASCWVRKEAYLKAIGLGLQSPPASHDLSASLDKAKVTLRLPDGRGRRTDWTMLELPLGDPYVAAVAIEGRNIGPVQWMLWHP